MHTHVHFACEIVLYSETQMIEDLQLVTDVDMTGSVDMDYIVQRVVVAACGSRTMLQTRTFESAILHYLALKSVIVRISFATCLPNI